MSSVPATSSGLKTSSGVIVARPCRIHAVILSPAAAASSAIVYDNATAASGTVIAKLLAVANGESVVFQSSEGVVCNNGAYLAITGASADCIVQYSLL